MTTEPINLKTCLQGELCDALMSHAEFALDRDLETTYILSGIRLVKDVPFERVVWLLDFAPVKLGFYSTSRLVTFHKGQSGHVKNDVV